MDNKFILSIVQMTEIREIEELRTFVLHSLKEIDGVYNIELISKILNRPLTKPADDNPYDISYHRIIHDGSIDKHKMEGFPLQDLMSNESNKSLNNNQNSIFPIHINSRTNEYALVKSNELTSQSKFNIEAILSIYKNQSELILASENDQLTGLRNRKSFKRFINQISTTEAFSNDANDITTNPSCLAMIDIDYFKKVNDEFGHLYGDEVLILFSRLMSDAFRTSDYIFRYGGEEFVVILSDTTPETSQLVLERFRAAAEIFVYPQVGIKTASIGYAKIIPNNANLSIDLADKALYHSKENGRNQTTFYDDIEAPDLQITNSETIFFNN